MVLEAVSIHTELWVHFILYTRNQFRELMPAYFPVMHHLKECFPSCLLPSFSSLSPSSSSSSLLLFPFPLSLPSPPSFFLLQWHHTKLSPVARLLKIVWARVFLALILDLAYVITVMAPGHPRMIVLSKHVIYKEFHSWSELQNDLL